MVVSQGHSLCRCMFRHCAEKGVKRVDLRGTQNRVHVQHVLSIFSFLLCFSFFSFLFLCFPLFSICFPYFQCFFLFHFVSLFSFLGCSKSVAALQYSLAKSAHSELALFAFAHVW